ncbi:ABC transporter permease [Nocardioides sp. cx-169]|uniref:ABC transporter permease n=1 Tax=Nocardioides sp. cx-169 TaxID=2899080 RepID=UPI001E581F33|nr:ABC transporter permease [Nocardioides sp. cx-169]MCD4534016.1 ABC transporter permease [Nocardioides sp. cx-169]
MSISETTATESDIKGETKLPPPGRRRSFPVGSVILFLAVMGTWEFLPPALNVKEFIFPRLSSVLEVFTSAERLELIARNLYVTFAEAMTGLALAIVFGVTLGFLLGSSPWARRMFYPYLIAIQGIPKVALAPLLLIWLGFGYETKVLMAALICFFPVLINTMSGVAGVNPQQLELFRALRASRTQLWFRLLFPTALPSIFAAVELVAVYATLGAIVAEFISAQSGVGVLLQSMQANYDTAGMFAVFMILSAMGVTINQLVRFLRRRVIFWER